MKEIVAAAAAAMFAAGSANAALVTVTFDEAVANYTPQFAPGPQVLTDELEPLGLVFSDFSTGLGVVLDDITGSSDQLHLYGNRGDGTADSTPFIRIGFTLPGSGGAQGYTDYFSILVTDGLRTSLRAYNEKGRIVGETQVRAGGRNERITLEGIGSFAYVIVTTPSDPTGYDDIIFAEVTASPVPVPAAALLFAPLAAGFLARRKG